MRILSWLDTCSSATRATLTLQSTIATSCDTTSSSDTPSSSTSISISSNLSIQTHPSLPSLQNLPSSQQLNLNYVVSQHCLASFRPHPSRPITSLAVHGNLLYAASAHEINVYDRHTLVHLGAFNGHDPSSGSTKAVAAFSNGSTVILLTAHQDSKIRVWNKKNQIVTSLPTVNDRLRRFLFPKNYAAIRRHKKRLWIEHADAVTGLAINNGTIYSVSWDKSLKIWRGRDFRCVESLKAHEDAVNAVVVSRDGVVYTGSADKRIRVWVKRPGGEKRHVLVATLERHKSAVNALALNDDGSLLFSGACDRSILVWEREESANHMVVSGALRGHGKAILCLINVRDLLLSGSADRTVRIWKRGGGGDGSYCCLTVLAGHHKPVKCLAAITESKGGDDDDDSDDGNGVVSVISGSLDGEIKVWRVSVSDSPVRSEHVIGVNEDH